MDEEKEEVVYLQGVKVTPVVLMEDGKFTQEFWDRVFKK